MYTEKEVYSVEKIDHFTGNIIYRYDSRNCAFHLYAYPDDCQIMFMSHIKVKYSAKGPINFNTLIEFVEKEVIRHNYTTLYMKIHNTPTLIEWYKNRGYDILYDDGLDVWIKKHVIKP